MRAAFSQTGREAFFAPKFGDWRISTHKFSLNFVGEIEKPN